jgi:hypothetical protein
MDKHSISPFDLDLINTEKSENQIDTQASDTTSSSISDWRDKDTPEYK